MSLFDENEKIAEELERNAVVHFIPGEKYLTIHRGKHSNSKVPPGLYKIDWDGLKKDLDALS